jgi:predicted regulator of Ras-like GTPase activity (Roadblock/LC7/MglB family)
VTRPSPSGRGRAGRHRAAASVRSDGLLAALAGLRGSDGITAAVLVDIESGLVLDGYTTDPAVPDLELLGAAHADLLGAAAALAEPGTEVEVLVGHGEGTHHLLRLVPDPHGDSLGLSVVARGSRRRAARLLERLRAVPIAALTAGPAVHRRPVQGTWTPSWPAGADGAAT